MKGLCMVLPRWFIVILLPYTAFGEINCLNPESCIQLCVKIGKSRFFFFRQITATLRLTLNSFLISGRIKISVDSNGSYTCLLDLCTISERYIKWKCKTKACLWQGWVSPIEPPITQISRWIEPQREHVNATLAVLACSKMVFFESFAFAMFPSSSPF